MSEFYDEVFEVFPYQGSDGTDHAPRSTLPCSEDRRGMMPATGWWECETAMICGDEEFYRFAVLMNSERGIFHISKREGYTCYLMPGPGHFGDGGETVLRFRDPPKYSLSWWPYEGW